jgi:CRP-like cAMP-binding protein
MTDGVPQFTDGLTRKVKFPMDEVAAFVRSHPIKKFGKDSIIVYQGEVPDALYAIRSGYVKIYDLSADGSEQLLGLAGKYDFIPSEVLFSSLTASQFFYGAFTPVELYAVDKRQFMERLRGDSAALYTVVQTVTEKYHSLLRHLAAVQKPKAREKIIHVLQFLAAHFLGGQSAGTSSSIALPFTQQDIANLVGVTRETAAHELKLLKNEGYITYSKHSFTISERFANLVE